MVTIEAALEVTMYVILLGIGVAGIWLAVQWMQIVRWKAAVRRARATAPGVGEANVFHRRWRLQTVWLNDELERQRRWRAEEEAAEARRRDEESRSSMHDWYFYHNRDNHYHYDHKT